MPPMPPMPAQANPLEAPFSEPLARLIDPALILAFHRATFGDLRMEDTSDAEAGGSAEEPPAKSLEDVVTELGLTPEQIAGRLEASRKWETRAKSRADYDAIKAQRDELLAASESATDKAIREATEAGRAAAQAESFTETATALLRMGLRAHGVTSDNDIAEIVDAANLESFKDESGRVDDDKITRYVQRNAGTASIKWPGTGQDRGGAAVGKSGIDAGKDMYAASRGKSTNS